MFHLNSSAWLEPRIENSLANSSNLFLNSVFMNFNIFSLILTIKNGQSTKKKSVLQKKTELSGIFLKILWNNGYILNYQVKKNQFKINLKYFKNKPVINSLKFISKPEKRIYFSTKQIWKLNSSKFFLFSTSKGIKNLTECKKQNIGGELFLIIN